VRSTEANAEPCTARPKERPK